MGKTLVEKAKPKLSKEDRELLDIGCEIIYQGDKKIVRRINNSKESPSLYQKSSGDYLLNSE